MGPVCSFSSLSLSTFPPPLCPPFPFPGQGAEGEAMKVNGWVEVGAPQIDFLSQQPRGGESEEGGSPPTHIHMCTLICHQRYLLDLELEL